jgi:hypothetical protein
MVPMMAFERPPVAFGSRRVGVAGTFVKNVLVKLGRTDAEPTRQSKSD